MAEQTPGTVPNSADTPQPESFITEAILAAKSTVPTPWASSSTPGTPPAGSTATPPAPKKPREPLTTATVLKAIGSLLAVAMIFFGSFLAYVVLNPAESIFFVTVFGINPNDVANLLKKLINVSFGIILFLLSIAWITTLFRAIWTPKDLKRRRLINWLLAGVIGIVLFFILAFWAFLFRIINATNYVNPGGDVSMYDNSLYTNPASKNDALLNSTANIIGPITIRYDISSNAKQVAQKNLMTIQSYEINFDGADCIGGRSVVSGSDPTGDQGIICTFDKTRNYTIYGSYKWVDRTGAPMEVAIPLQSVEVRWLLSITEQKNKDGKTIETIDANGILNLGSPRWVYSTDPTHEITNQNSITQIPSSTPLLICLKVFANNCDRTFIIQDTSNTDVSGSIIALRDSANPLQYTLSLSGVNLNTSNITNIKWSLDNGTIICADTPDTCIYTFSQYQKVVITATIELTGGQVYTIKKSLSIDQPITLTSHVQVRDQNGTILNPPDSLSPSLQAYVIQNITVPDTITLDARDVLSENPGYTLTGVTWEIDDGTSVEHRTGKQINLSIDRYNRYTIHIEYLFAKNINVTSDDLHMARDTIIFDLARKNINPILAIQTTSDYVPAKVTVDASQSTSQDSEIKKFIFDFWEGKPPAEWDAIQTYEYTTAGQKDITLTVINARGETASIKKTIVLKDAPRIVDFSISMSPGIINMPVDFTAADSAGNIADYIWNFGDNTPVVHGYQVTHSYTTSGTYKVTLVVRYNDGTEKQALQNFPVVTSLE